jgi:aspartokinase
MSININAAQTKIIEKLNADNESYIEKINFLVDKINKQEVYIDQLLLFKTGDSKNEQTKIVKKEDDTTLINIVSEQQINIDTTNLSEEEKIIEFDINSDDIDELRKKLNEYMSKLNVMNERTNNLNDLIRRQKQYNDKDKFEIIKSNKE